MTAAHQPAVTEPRADRQPGAPVRETKRRAQTRARLLDAAFGVFAAKGFGQVTIEQVCEAAGYTRGAFYSNFDSLDELFFALYDERAHLIAGQLAQAFASAEEDLPIAALAERVSRVLLLEREWLLVKTDFLVQAARNPALAHVLSAHRGQLRQVVAERLRLHAERNPLPAALPDVEAAAWAAVAVYDGVTVQLLLDGDTSGARAWLAQLLTALLADRAGAGTSADR